MHVKPGKVIVTLPRPGEMNARRAAAFLLAAALLPAGLRGPAGAATLELPRDAGAPAGGTATVSVGVDDASGMLGTDLVITYDPAVATATGVAVTGLSAEQTLVTNLSVPGVIRIALYGIAPLSGTGALIDISFTSTGAPGAETVLHFAWADLNEGAIPATLIDGRYCVQDVTGEVGSLALTPTSPPGTALLAWSPAPLAAEYNVYRGAQRNLADLACFLPGVAGASTPDDGAVPPAGGLFVYLVTAANCRGESTLGWSTSGAERSASSPCP